MEKTLVLLKPDAVERGLVGEIISRFEKADLKLLATKMVWPDEELAQKHYPTSRHEFIQGMGNKTLESHAEAGEDVKAIFGTEDPHEIGLQLQKWLVDFLVSGPVIALVLKGENAIKKVREIAGHTIPAKAESGSIRGDYSDDSALKANAEKRSLKNLVHASGSQEEAEFEIGLWFSSDELHNY
ncbi:MAG TPA: nucleoside-diphosphate kinase [Candidatus Saccharimonadales bacterium]|nr:nucleoside-diphosphate kinase [Candidatus Saccharimonadales bacterium]